MKKNKSFWIKKWINKAMKIKIISLCLFITNFFCFVLLFIIKNMINKKIIKVELLALLIAIFAITTIITFFIAVCTLFLICVRVRQYDNYTILIYTGFFKRFLLVEGFIQDQGFLIRFLYGQLPNKKHIWVDCLSPFSIKIGVGEKEKLTI